MTITEVKLVKSTDQSFLELAYTIVFVAVTFYSLRPDMKEKHLTIVRAQVKRIKHWISVQDALAEIRDLPETGNSCNT